MLRKKKEIKEEEKTAKSKKTPKKVKKEAELPPQPVMNIGMIGHVDHGKTTLTETLSGKWTDTHSEEIKKGITIRLGYADVIIRKCPKCSKPECYTVKETCEHCNAKTIPVRKISIVDAPGHESLMATMLSGATIMDAALLIVAANETCPQPQTKEHLMALEIIGVKKAIIAQNKIDLLSEEETLKNYNEIKEFLKETQYKDAPIIPMSAQQGINIDALLAAIEENFPTPEREKENEPIMFIARSFDINKPGTELQKIMGGVLGGTLAKGKLRKGDEIEIKPGYSIEKGGRKIWEPLHTKIIELKTGKIIVDEVSPGGSIGIMTSLDPSIVKSDNLAGSLAGLPGKLPKVWYKFKLETHLLERVVGAKDKLVVEPIKLGELLMLNVNSTATIGQVSALGKNQISCNLRLPICAEEKSRVTISRMIGARWRLVGYGIIVGE